MRRSATPAAASQRGPCDVPGVRAGRRVGALLDKESGVALTHVPYRGTVPGIQDLLGGQVASFSRPFGGWPLQVEPVVDANDLPKRTLGIGDPEQAFALAG
jgi:hypothetical protein